MFSVGDEAILVTIGLPNTVGTAGFIVCLVGVPALGVVLCIRLWRQKGIRAELLGQIVFPYIVERLGSRVYVLGGNEAFLVRAWTRG